jgi:hypothetical protein
VLKRAADIFAARHRNVGAEEQRRDNSRLNRLAIDFVADQLREHTGSLRMSDEHDTAPVVVVLQVVIPRVDHIAVRHRAIGRDRFTGRVGA